MPLDILTYSVPSLPHNGLSPFMIYLYQILPSCIDVVQAYKGLQKEKNALEKSLRVLSTGGNVDSAEKDSDLDESLNEESENTVKERTSDSTKIPQPQHFKPEKREVNTV